MQAALLVRPMTDDERQTLEDGLRSLDGFILRRCQILLANVRGEHSPAIAQSLGCDTQTARNAIHTFHADGLAALDRGSTRPDTIHAAFDTAGIAGLRDLLHQSPRDCGHATRLWTLDLLAEVAFDQGLTSLRVTGGTVRATFECHGIRWQHAKQWNQSPDPQYAQKTTAGSADAVGCSTRSSPSGCTPNDASSSWSVCSVPPNLKAASMPPWTVNPNLRSVCPNRLPDHALRMRAAPYIRHSSDGPAARGRYDRTIRR